MAEPGTGKFSGIQGSVISVSLDDGSSFETSLDPIRLPSRGSRLFRKARAIALQKVVLQEAKIRSILRLASSKLNNSVNSLDSKRESDGRLPARDRRRLRVMADNLTRLAILDIRSTLAGNITSAVNRQSTTHNEFLGRKNLSRLSSESLKSLETSVIRTVMTRSFPGTSKTVTNRLGALSVRMRKLMRSFINAPREDLKRRLSILRRGLHDPKPGPTNIDGGSLGKAIGRINRTEQARAMRDITLKLGEKSGIEYAYWRLSTRHKWQGNEICEKISQSTGPGVISRIRAQGIDDSLVDTTGLYLVRLFPSIPHPNCMCYQELSVL